MYPPEKVAPAELPKPGAGPTPQAAKSGGGAGGVASRGAGYSGDDECDDDKENLHTMGAGGEASRGGGCGNDDDDDEATGEKETLEEMGITRASEQLVPSHIHHVKVVVANVVDNVDVLGSVVAASIVENAQASDTPLLNEPTLSGGTPVQGNKPSSLILQRTGSGGIQKGRRSNRNRLVNRVTSTIATTTTINNSDSSAGVKCQLSKLMLAFLASLVVLSIASIAHYNKNPHWLLPRPVEHVYQVDEVKEVQGNSVFIQPEQEGLVEGQASNRAPPSSSELVGQGLTTGKNCLPSQPPLLLQPAVVVTKEMENPKDVAGTKEAETVVPGKVVRLVVQKEEDVRRGLEEEGSSSNNEVTESTSFATPKITTSSSPEIKEDVKEEAQEMANDKAEFEDEVEAKDEAKAAASAITLLLLWWRLVRFFSASKVVTTFCSNASNNNSQQTAQGNHGGEEESAELMKRKMLEEREEKKKQVRRLHHASSSDDEYCPSEGEGHVVDTRQSFNIIALPTRHHDHTAPEVWAPTAPPSPYVADFSNQIYSSARKRQAAARLLQLNQQQPSMVPDEEARQFQRVPSTKKRSHVQEKNRSNSPQPKKLAR